MWLQPFGSATISLNMSYNLYTSISYFVLNKMMFNLSLAPLHVGSKIESAYLVNAKVTSVLIEYKINDA